MPDEYTRVPCTLRPMDGVSPVAEAAFISLEGGGNVQTAIADLQAVGGGGEGGGLSLSQVQDVVSQALIPYSLSTEITAQIAAAIANIPASETGGGEIGITIDDVNNAIAQALFPYRPAAETDTAIADAIAAALLPYATISRRFRRQLRHSARQNKSPPKLPPPWRMCLRARAAD